MKIRLPNNDLYDYIPTLHASHYWPTGGQPTATQAVLWWQPLEDHLLASRSPPVVTLLRGTC